MKPARTGSLGLLAFALALPMAACSSSDDSHKLTKISLQGTEIADPQSALDKARTTFFAANQPMIDSKAQTTSPDTNCFYRRDAKKSESVLPTVFCGPILRAGAAKTDVWDTYDAQLAQSGSTTSQGDGADAPSGTAASGVVEIGAQTGAGVSVDTALLVRPDGKKPADGKKLKAPTLPKSTVKDTAYLAKESDVQAGVSFKNLDKPAVLRTPAATITVTASASSPTVPSWFQAGLLAQTPTDSDGPDDLSNPPALAAADGQDVKVYRVTVGPGSGYPDPNVEAYGNTGPAKGAATLSVGVGSQRLSISQKPGESFGSTTSSGSTFVIDCDSVPCKGSDGGQTTSYVLAVSAAKGQPQNLSASVNGSTLAVPLTGGAVQTDVSTTDQKRPAAVQQLNATVTSHELKMDPVFGPAYQMGGSIPAAFLSGFDYKKGWAPAGKAWLEVPVTGIDSSNTDFNVIKTKTGAVSANGATYAADSSAGALGTFAFLVPDTFSSGTFTYQPQGSVRFGYPSKTAAFTLPAYTVKLSIPN